MALIPADQVAPDGDRGAAREQALQGALDNGVVAEHDRGAVFDLNTLTALDGEAAESDELGSQDGDGALDGDCVLAFALERQALSDLKVFLIGAGTDPNCGQSSRSIVWLLGQLLVPQ